MIEDLLSENIIDFYSEYKKEEVFVEEKIVKEDFTKLTKLQIVTIAGEVVDV